MISEGRPQNWEVGNDHSLIRRDPPRAQADIPSVKSDSMSWSMAEQKRIDHALEAVWKPEVESAPQRPPDAESIVHHGINAEEIERCRQQGIDYVISVPIRLYMAHPKWPKRRVFRSTSVSNITARRMWNGICEDGKTQRVKRKCTSSYCRSRVPPCIFRNASTCGAKSLNGEACHDRAGPVSSASNPITDVITLPTWRVLRELICTSRYLKGLLRHEEKGVPPEKAILRVAEEVMDVPFGNGLDGRRLRALRRSIEQEWGDVLRKLMNVGELCGWLITKCSGCSGQKDGSELHFALCSLAFEANRTLFAITNQIRSALPSDTFGYLRTLHEIVVKSLFLRKHTEDDPDLPARYLLHITRTYAQLYREVSLLYGEEGELEQTWQSALQFYESRFGIKGKGDYGWAHPSVKNRRPTFRDLMDDCGGDLLFSDFYYSMSTSKTHGDLVWNPLVVLPDARSFRIDAFGQGGIGLVMELAMPLAKEIMASICPSCVVPEHARVMSVVEAIIQHVQDSLRPVIEKDPMLHLGLRESDQP